MHFGEILRRVGQVAAVCNLPFAGAVQQTCPRPEPPQWPIETAGSIQPEPALRRSRLHQLARLGCNRRWLLDIICAVEIHVPHFLPIATLAVFKS